MKHIDELDELAQCLNQADREDYEALKAELLADNASPPLTHDVLSEHLSGLDKAAD